MQEKTEQVTELSVCVDKQSCQGSILAEKACSVFGVGAWVGRVG